MTAEFLTGFFFEAIKTAILLAAPMLLAGLLVGLLVSIFQAATSIAKITNQTVSIVPENRPSFTRQSSDSHPGGPLRFARLPPRELLFFKSFI